MLSRCCLHVVVHPFLLWSHLSIYCLASIIYGHCSMTYYISFYCIRCHWPFLITWHFLNNFTDFTTRHLINLSPYSMFACILPLFVNLTTILLLNLFVFLHISFSLNISLTVLPGTSPLFQFGLLPKHKIQENWQKNKSRKEWRQQKLPRNVRLLIKSVVKGKNIFSFVRVVLFRVIRETPRMIQPQKWWKGKMTAGKKESVHKKELQSLTLSIE